MGVIRGARGRGAAFAAIITAAPTLPESPATPTLPESSAASKLPESSAAPKLPESPAAPKLPESPAAPTLPESPATPTLPESSTAPTLPESPAAPTLPESPATPTPPESSAKPLAPPLDLHWDAPEGCPSRPALEARISTLVPDRLAGAEVSVDVELRRSTTGFAGTLALRTPWGNSTRDLQAERCETVAEATALLVAIAIDPLATEQTLERTYGAPARPSASDHPLGVPAPRLATSPGPITAAEGPDEPRPSTRASAAEAPPPSTDAPPPRAHRGFVRIEAGGGLGLLPQPGVILAGAIGYHHRWLRVGAHGRYWLPQQINHPLDSTVSADLTLWGAGAHGCAGPRWDAIELPICAGLDGGLMRGTGRGALARMGTDRRPWIAARLGPALAWSPRPFLALWAGLDVATALLRPRFQIAALGPIFEMRVLSGRAFIAIEARFP